MTFHTHEQKSELSLLPIEDAPALAQAGIAHRQGVQTGRSEPTFASSGSAWANAANHMVRKSNTNRRASLSEQPAFYDAR